MSTYNGMKWLKCDLQMQTPADAQHWQGDALVPGSEEGAARAFAEACRAARLDVVAITDHNFLSKDFLPFLLDAFRELERSTGHRVVAFPGFEFEAAGVGRGAHVLCLFEPGTDLATVDATLTECGVGHPRVEGDGRLRKSDKNLKEILRIVQDLRGGIVILPHILSNDGLFDNESISEWLQKDQYTYPDLMAVEVPKPVHQMSPAFQRLFSSGPDCLPEWRRIRPIATVMSSDNKKLIESGTDGRPTSNSIGCRYSWIKMSRPSIESLRQAFLDCDSRIRLPEDVVSDRDPGQLSRHPVIRRIAIRGVPFLADQEVVFSPNLNCVIGGRGSGKSTVLEYLRCMFSRHDGEEIDPDTRIRIQRVRDTMDRAGVRIEVEWESAGGLSDTIVWEGGQLSVIGRDLADPDTFFRGLPLRVLSQQQLNRLTESTSGLKGERQAQRLLELVDGFNKSALSDLATEERAILGKIDEALTHKRRADAAEVEVQRLNQELQELRRQWTARSEIQSDSERHGALRAEGRYLDNTISQARVEAEAIVPLVAKIVRTHSEFSPATAPHAGLLAEVAEAVLTAKQELELAVRTAVMAFEAGLSGIEARASVKAMREAITGADAEFASACAAKGLSVDDVGRLQEIGQVLQKKEQELRIVEAEAAAQRASASPLDRLHDSLHATWRSQYAKRLEAALRANELAVLEDSEHAFIHVETYYQGDKASFQEHWNSLAPPDGRTRLGRNWTFLGDQLHEAFKASSGAPSPWDILSRTLLDEAGQMVELFGELGGEVAEYLRSRADDLAVLRTRRVDDVVDMTVFRSDGTVAGRVADGTLSDGQRNTAALALLLAQDGGPLVVDQPEDELDSNFVFRELVPMLRKVKNGRQIIVATHNANLPVNGDAELVVALEARRGRGEIRASGGLDAPEVTHAILDVMEGTEEAFRRRREKYHF